MGVNLHRTSHVLLFVLIIPTLSIGLAYVFHTIFPSPPFWVDTLTPLVGYGLIYSLFDKYIWAWPIMKGVIQVPDLRGRWEGIQRSSHQENGVSIEYRSVLEIKQTFTSINLCAFYQKSNSQSTIAGFAELNCQPYLFYVYDNDPNSFKSGTMQMHKGFAKLKHLTAGNKLTGGYFNSIGNTGDVELEFKGGKLLGRF